MMRFIKNRTVQQIWSGICAVGIISCFLFLTVYGAEPTGENQTQTETAWEENYTDTSSEKGMLAVRCQTFQGFQGTVHASVIQEESGRAYSVLLEPENGYIQNLELPAGDYCLSSIEAVSENRQFACTSQSEEFSVEMDEVVVCRIAVEPSGRIPFPEEPAVATPPEADQSETEQAARPDTKQIESIPEVEASMAGETEREEVLPKLSEDMENQGKARILLISGLMGMVALSAWLIWLWKRR